MSFKVATLANAVVDMCFGGIDFPIRPNEHQFVKERLITPGGMANTTLLGARLGMQMRMLGSIGDDDVADLWRAPLVAAGIDVSQMLIDDQPTAVAITLSDVDGEHVFVGSRGSRRLGDKPFPTGWRDAIATADALLVYGWSYLSMGPSANLDAIEVANSAEIPVFFDPGPEIPAMPPDWLQAMLAGSNVVLLTYDEAQMAVGEALPPAEMAERVRQQGPEMVLLKLGANGIVGHTANQTIHQPGISVTVVDLTAAGDSVAASAIHSYLARHSLQKLLVLANATGAACVQKFGAGVNVPYLPEIEALLRQSESQYSLLDEEA